MGKMPDSSTMLGAPPGRWKRSEVLQMKKVRQAFKAALVDAVDDEEEEKAADLMNLAQSETFVELVGRAGGKTSKKASPEESDEEGGAAGAGTNLPEEDQEGYLPSDSVLRSVDGEGKVPKNVPFKDYATFVNTKDFEHWKDYFRGQDHDRFLTAIAESLVSHFCSAQAADLRVRHGSVPLGRVLRKKREHITPLALTLHELKLWAVNWLRTASVFEQATYRQIERRMQYLELLQRKEVWRGAARPLQSGMRPVSHDSLFRLMLTTREDLHRARDYAYRGFTRRASREKLSRLGNLLKDVLFNEMKVISGLFSLNKKLSDPKTRKLQPTDLLSSWQNQTFVDYQNIANVLLSALCHVPLFRGALLSNYDSEDVKSSLLDIRNWSAHNLFVLPGHSPAKDGSDEDGEGGEDEEGDEQAAKNSEPVFQFDDEASGLLPEVYKVQSERVRDELAKADPHAKPPLTRKHMLKQLRKAFSDSNVIELLMQRLLICLAALQDLAPSIYISFELWSLAGQGGDFVLFDLLREQCIGVMQNTIARVHTLQTATKRLMGLFHRLVKEYEAGVERRRLLSKKARYQPAWVENYYAVKDDQVRTSRKAFSETYMQLWELARDAWEYDLTADQLNDKIDTLRRLCDEFAPSKSGSFTGKFKTSHFVDLGANNWLGLSKKRKGQGKGKAAAEPRAPEKEEGGLAPESSFAKMLDGAQAFSDDETMDLSRLNFSDVGSSSDME